MENESKIPVLTRIAWMHYIQQMTHEEIAGQLKMSRPTVTRMLIKARELGIVQIDVKGAYRSCIEAGEALRKKARINDVIVVPSGRDNEESRDGVARAAAEYLMEKLMPDDVLGLSWGKTLDNIAKYLKQVKNGRITTVQLMGGINKSGSINPQQILTSITKTINAVGFTNPVPAVVDNKDIKEAILHDKSVQEIFEKAKIATVALLGIGDMGDTSSLKQIGAISLSDFLALKKAGAVGDVLAWFFKRSGEKVDAAFNERVMSVDENIVKRIPLKIGVTSGDYKCDAVIGALNGGWIDTLIIDECLAEKVNQNL